jgi:hypothetical protein
MAKESLMAEFKEMPVAIRVCVVISVLCAIGLGLEVVAFLVAFLVTVVL